MNKTNKQNLKEEIKKLLPNKYSINIKIKKINICWKKWTQLTIQIQTSDKKSFIIQVEKIGRTYKFNFDDKFLHMMNKCLSQNNFLEFLNIIKEKMKFL